MLSTGTHVPRAIIADDESDCTYSYHGHDFDDGSTIATSASGDHSEVETSAWTKLGMALLWIDPRDDDDSCWFPGSMASSSCCDSSSTVSGSVASCDYSTASGDEVEGDTQEATHTNSPSTNTENKSATVSSNIISEVISTTPEETEACINISASQEAAPKNQSKASQAVPGKKIPSSSHSPRTHQHRSELLEKDLGRLVNDEAAKAKGQEAKAVYRIEVVLPVREEEHVGTQAKTNRMAQLTRKMFQRK